MTTRDDDAVPIDVAGDSGVTEISDTELAAIIHRWRTEPDAVARELRAERDAQRSLRLAQL